MGYKGVINFHESHFQNLKKIKRATRLIKVLNFKVAEGIINHGFSYTTEDIFVNDKLSKIYVFTESPELMSYIQENCSAQDYYFDINLHF